MNIQEEDLKEYEIIPQDPLEPTIIDASQLRQSLHGMRDQIDTMIKMLKNLVDEFKFKIVFTSFSHFKAEKSEVIEKLVVNNGLEFDREYKKYFSKNTDQRIVCTGSNYFNGLIMSELNLS